MALLEDGNLCCICDERQVRRCVGSIPAYYCVECFKAHEQDIIDRAPWVHFLMNGEKQRRKRRNRLLAAEIPLAPVYATTGQYA